MRSASASKPAYTNLIAQGVKVVTVDLDGPEAELVKALQGQDVVIASVPPIVLESQLPLIRAAKLANVKRFIPSAFAMAIAPSDVSSAQQGVGLQPDRYEKTLCSLCSVNTVANTIAEGEDLRRACGVRTSLHDHRRRLVVQRLHTQGSLGEDGPRHCSPWFHPEPGSRGRRDENIRGR